MKDARILFGGVSLLLIIILTAVSCSDDKNITGGVTGTTSGDFRLTVQVRGYICYLYNDPYGEHRYTVVPGGKARASVYQDGVFIGENYADDSSYIRLALDSGVYDITLETDHSWPFNYRNITIEQDTFIYLDFIQNLWSPDILIFFHYDYAGDSLGYDTEWRYIRELTGDLADMFDAEKAERSVKIYYFSPDTSASITYYVPVAQRHFTWYVYDKLSKLFHENKDNYPNMSLGVCMYICPNGN